MNRRLCYIGAIVATLLVTAILRPLNTLGTLAQGNCRTYPETGYNVCGKFLTYWDQHGGLAQQGYPLGPEVSEKSELNGQTYTVQYFERAVFELHPENQPPYDVLLSQLGTSQAQRRYGNPPRWPGAPAPTPVPPLTVGSSVRLRDGVTLTLVNTYDDRITGLGTASCGGAVMRWVFKLENSSASGFPLNFDATTAKMVDSTGQLYKGQDNGCNAGSQYIGYEAFERPSTLAPNQTVRAQALFLTPNVPQSASYFDFTFLLSGQPLTYRFILR